MWSADYGDRLKMWNCEYGKDVWGTASQRFSFTTGKTEKVFITWLLHFRKSRFFSFFQLKKKKRKKIYPKHKPPSAFRCCVQGSTVIEQVVEVPILLLFYCKEEHESSCSSNALNVRSRANAS